MNVIKVEKACKQFGFSSDSKVVLKDFSMRVKRGSIYALMGSSGCGKTTLFSCIVGLQHLDSGRIKIFGDEVGKNNLKIGYMPQETALVPEFSGKEMFCLYGTIYGMDQEKIREKFDFLAKLLDLPDGNKFIKNCSGGQQRRISFALTLIHEPEILILDEPTVGVDPLLRSKIWDYLVDLTESKKVTVLLSTHYIEEAKESSHVGLMRNGIQIAEDSPQNILQMCETTILEEAFLKLSHQQDECIQPVINRNSEQTSWETCDEDFEEISKQRKVSSIKIMKALVVKNGLQFIRHPGGVLSAVLLPILSIICMYYAIGGNVTNMVIGIVNEEISSFSECKNSTQYFTQNKEFKCEIKKTSCLFIENLKDDVAIKKIYNKFEDAYADAKSAKIIGFLYFSPNFTESNPFFNENSKTDLSDNGFVQIYLDNTDLQKNLYITRKLFDVYQNFSRTLLAGCGYAKEAANSPIHFDTFYGSFDDELKFTMTPGATLAIFFSLASYLTSSALIEDRLAGFWDRFTAAGVKPRQFFISHLVPACCLMTIQAFEFLVFSIYLNFNFTWNFVILVWMLLLLMGLTGISYGLLISVSTDSTLFSSSLCLIGIFPFLSLSGVFWPFEAIPSYLQYVAYCVPFTFPTKSFISINSKNSTIDNPEVFKGFIVLTLWVVIQLSLCFWIVGRWNRKKSNNIEK